MPYVPEFERHYDVIVVGARPAGAATAMLLARTGFKVLVVDRQTYGSDTLSTHALLRGAVMQLSRWGLIGEIVKAGTPAVRRTTFHYGEEKVEIGFRPDAHIDALYAPRRTVLDRVLVDAARDAGADVRHGVTLMGLLSGRGGRIVGASIRDRGGAIHTIAADLVVGADGRHSTVARLVGAPTYRRSRHHTALVYGHIAGLENQGYQWFYSPGVSAGVIPTNNDETCVFVSIPPDRFAREISEGPYPLFDKVLAEASSQLAEEVTGATLTGHLHGFPGEAGYFRHSFGAGWALVGDSGYFKDPLTAHGITDGLRDAELLALAIADGRPQAYRHYQDERDALSTELFEATDAIASFEWDIETLKSHNQRLSKALKAETVAFAARGEPVALAA